MRRLLRDHEAAARLARQLTGLDDGLEALGEGPTVARTSGSGDHLDALLDGLGFGRPLRERLHRQRSF